MPCDLLVKLYDLPPAGPMLDTLRADGIDVRRALPIDKHIIVPYVRDSFLEVWGSECEVSFSRQPPSCFVAVHNKCIVGFACYNATCWGFFGPVGVTEAYRGRGIGTGLLLRSLLAMWDEGYAYSVIGWVDDEVIPFYRKIAGATVIGDSFPGIYRRMIKI